MNIAYIICLSGDKCFDGESTYALIYNNAIIATHSCSNRSFANHDLTTWRIELLKECNIDMVYSNNEAVWHKCSQTINNITQEKYKEANREYEEKNCRGEF